MNKKSLDKVSFILGALGTIISAAAIGEADGYWESSFTHNKYPIAHMNVFWVRIGLWLICLSFILQCAQKFSKTEGLSERGVYVVILLAGLAFLAISIFGTLLFL